MQLILNEKYGLPVYLENDVNLLALVENLNGSLASSHHNITLKFDYGIGGAVVLNNQLCSAAGQVAGEFGHYKISSGEEALLCHCGAKGCLTTIASLSGMKRYRGLTLEEFNTLIRNNEAEAVSRFQIIMEAVSLAIANLITFLNPEHVLLTGLLIDKMGDAIIPELKDRIVSLVPETCRSVELLQLPFTPNESISAAGLVMNHYFDVPLEKLSLG